MAPLDQRDRELLEGYKASLSPPEAVVLSNWEAITEIVERDPIPRTGAHTLWIGVAVAVALVLGSWVTFHASERLRDDDAYRVQSLDREVAPRAAVAPAIAPAGDASPRRANAVDEPSRRGPTSAEARQDEAPTPAVPGADARPAAATGPAAAATMAKPPGKRAASARVRSEPASSPSNDTAATDLRAELELLGRARAALEAEDFERVLALVQRHAREFPRGTMREEIALLRVGALCEVGPEERWASARSRFEREFPGSPLAAHLREDCLP